MHDETKHATSRSPNSTDDCIECPTCYDTFAKTDLLKSRCFKSGTEVTLTKLVPMLKSTECTAQDGPNPFIMCTVPADVTRVVDGQLPFNNYGTTSSVDGQLPFDGFNDDSDN